MPLAPSLGDVSPLTQATTQSLMDQAAQNRRQEEAAQMDRIKFQILRPVMESEARAKLAGAAVDLTATHIINSSIATDLQRLPDYVKQWTDSAVIEDPKERLTERRRILGAMAPFASIKSAAPVVKAFQDQFAQDAMADKTADLISGRAEVVAAQNDARAAKTAADNEVKLRQKELDLQARETALKQQAELFKAKQEFEARQTELKAAHAKEIQEMRGEQAQTRTETVQGGGIRKQREAEAFKVNSAAMDLGKAAGEANARFESARQLLDDPEVKTGTGAGVGLKLERLGSLFGMQLPKTAKLEQVNSILGSTFLDYVKQMKGNLSDKDREALQAITPSMAQTNEGNKALLNMLIQKNARDVQVRDMMQDMREKEFSEWEIMNAANRFVVEHPLTFGAVKTTRTLADIDKEIAELEARKNGRTNP